MKGANIVQSAVKKASKASKRKGKWVNLQEIRSKMPKTNKEPIPPILRYLSREDRIEKKKNFQLWRPKDNNGMFSRAVGAAIVSEQHLQ